MRTELRTTAGITAAAAALILVLGGCTAQASAGGTSSASTDAASPEASETGMTASFLDPAGEELGTVEITEVDGVVQMRVEATGMPPGFHAFHVHGIGLCEPASADPADPAVVGDFLSAGGHLGADASDHGQHMGDLPSLFVESDGTGLLVAQTDAFTMDELMDADGSAFMVHAGLDDFANIPERYSAAGPDEETRKTGDAGGRIACAAITP